MHVRFCTYISSLFFATLAEIDFCKTIPEKKREKDKRGTLFSTLVEYCSSAFFYF